MAERQVYDLEDVVGMFREKSRMSPFLPLRYLQITSVASLRAYANVHAGWALDGRPTAGSQKFEFEQAQRDMRLKEPPKPEQVYDFSLLDELGKQ